jgi:hypothetical protein
MQGSQRSLRASYATKSRADPRPGARPFGDPPIGRDRGFFRPPAGGADAELGPLFGFNQFVDTLRGPRLATEGRPRVDARHVVVELDGYASHGNRIAFMHDRHRDYELALSGYRVLRLANDEVVQDLEKAIAKIRDLVCLCRTRAVSEE